MVQSIIFFSIAILHYCFGFIPPQLFTTTPQTTSCFNTAVPCPIRHSLNSHGVHITSSNDHVSLSCRRRRYYLYNRSALRGAYDCNNEEDRNLIPTVTPSFEEYLAQRGGGGRQFFDESSSFMKVSTDNVGEYRRDLGLEREAPNVGDPQVAQLEPMNITQVMTELQAIQSQGPKKYCILGTRHCSFLHQQIVEML